MEKKDKRYQAYLRILKEELVPAMGCTEPIALAYCAAKAREILGCMPDSVLVEASGNIIKNVKSVVVPNTNGLKGMEAAAAAGIVAGEADRALEVIAGVTEGQKEEISRFLKAGKIQVRPMDTEEVLDMAVTLWKGGEEARVQISRSHTNIVLIEKDGEALYRESALIRCSGRRRMRIMTAGRALWAANRKWVQKAETGKRPTGRF